MKEEKKIMIRRAFLFPVSLYRRLISPIKKPSCRYIPSCSEYFETSVIKDGVLVGSMKGLYRILRCNPFAVGGYDPP